MPYPGNSVCCYFFCFEDELLHTSMHLLFFSGLQRRQSLKSTSFPGLSLFLTSREEKREPWERGNVVLMCKTADYRAHQTVSGNGNGGNDNFI